MNNVINSTLQETGGSVQLFADTLTTSDSHLVERARVGDVSAFDVLVHRHYGKVFSVAYAKTANRETAEDLAQEVFLRAYLSIDGLTNTDRFAAWICQITRNLAEDWRRQNHEAVRLVRLVSVEQATLENVEDTTIEPASTRVHNQEQLIQLERALQRLTPEAREVVLLHYVEKMNPREIGTMLGVHRTTIRYHLKRAMDDLREQMLEAAPDIHALGSLKAAGKARTAALIASVSLLGVESRASLAALSDVERLSEGYTNFTAPRSPRVTTLSQGDVPAKVLLRAAGVIVVILLAWSIIMPFLAKQRDEVKAGKPRPGKNAASTSRSIP